jgi:hypothetical protein
MKFSTLLFLIMAPVAHAIPVELGWTDNSDDEDGFEMRGRLPDQTIEVVAITAPDVERLQVESTAHEAWQVWAFKIGWEGEKIYSLNGTNVLEKPKAPNGPSDLRPPPIPRQASHRHRYKHNHKFK